MDTGVTLALLWAAFIATHLGLASAPVEPRLRERLGEPVFLALYSAVALVLFVPLVQIYLDHRHAGAALWVLPIGPAVRGVLYLVMLLALVLVVAGIVRPSPASLAPGEARVSGANRVTRHPLTLGLGLLMALHLLPFGYTTDLVFFGGFTLFAVLGAWHQDRRKLRNGPPEFASFHRDTPFLPFSRPGALRGLAEIPVWVYAVSIALLAGIRWLHPMGIWPH